MGWILLSAVMQAANVSMSSNLHHFWGQGCFGLYYFVGLQVKKKPWTDTFMTTPQVLSPLCVEAGCYYISGTCCFIIRTINNRFNLCLACPSIYSSKVWVLYNSCTQGVLSNICSFSSWKDGRMTTGNNYCIVPVVESPELLCLGPYTQIWEFPSSSSIWMTSVSSTARGWPVASFILNSDWLWWHRIMHICISISNISSQAQRLLLLFSSIHFFALTLYVITLYGIFTLRLVWTHPCAHVCVRQVWKEIYKVTKELQISEEKHFCLCPYLAQFPSIPWSESTLAHRRLPELWPFRTPRSEVSHNLPITIPVITCLTFHWFWLQMSSNNL